MNISMDKQYRTRDGREVDVVRVNVEYEDPNYTVLALVQTSPLFPQKKPHMYSPIGRFFYDQVSDHDLVEVHEHESWPIDTLVDVWRKDGQYVGRFHYAGCRESDKAARVWIEGRSSLTSRHPNDTMVILPGFRIQNVSTPTKG